MSGPGPDCEYLGESQSEEPGVNRKLVISAIIGALAGLTLRSSAVAASYFDHKTYRAFGCVQDGVATDAFNRSQYRITRMNDSGGSALLCPIIRQDTSNSRASDFVRAQVSVARSVDMGDLSCTLYEDSSDGSSVRYDVEYATPGFDTIDLEVTNLWFQSSLHLQCNMPVNVGAKVAKIFTYSTTEYDQ
jgi:hypothetical protein